MVSQQKKDQTSQNRRKELMFAVLSIILLVFSILSSLTLPTIITKVIHRRLILKEGSETYENWKRVPVPLYNRFYFFNVVNPIEVERNGAKPILAEIGPFTYRVILQKYDITHYSNGTVSYRERRTWNFVRNLSVSDDTTEISTLNTPLAMSLSWLRTASPTVQLVARVGLETTTQGFFIKRSVKELLFDGYPDILTTLGMLLRPEVPSVYRGRFGYFYPKNNTDDGLYRVITGENNISQLNLIESHNGASHLNYWTSEECNDLRRSTKSETRSPLQSDTHQLHMFNSEICRVLKLVYERAHREVFGILAKRFTLDLNTYKNSHDYPPNACYHVKRPNSFLSFRSSLFESDPLPSGVMDLGPCKYGAPIYLSNPHFLDADPIYINSVSGLKPNRENHSFWLDVEPTTGSTVQVAARIQLNVATNVGQTFLRFRRIPQIIWPVMWSEYRSQLTPNLAEKLGFVQWLPAAVTDKVFYLFVSFSLIMLIMAIYLHFNKILKTKKRAAQPSTPISVATIPYSPPSQAPPIALAPMTYSGHFKN